MRKRRFIFPVALMCALALPGWVRGQFGGGGAGATQGARQYFSNTMVGEALIEVDPETRSIIVIADEETNAQIQSVIQNVDRAKPQVLIKVAFVEVTHRNEFDLGIEGSGTIDQRDASTGVLESIFGLTGETSGGFYRLFENEYEITLRALAEEGEVEVLSRPSILARNNQQAIITIGQEVPFIQNSQVLQNGQLFNTVEYEDIGIILRVTPFITQKRQVEMIVEPEISSTTDETVVISAGVEAPVFSKRSAQTVVVTPHGETVVIGGLMSNEKVKSVRKIPILGDIPLLGIPFRRTITSDVKTELLIFLTPYIVPTPEELVELTRLERTQTREMEHAFSPEELGRLIPTEEEDASESGSEP